MADVITRFKVESQEYDAKVKRASEGLLHFEQACRKVNGTMAILDKEEEDFVRSLGKMETVTRSARGSVAELTKAYEDLSLQYQRLTREEQQGQYGRALSSSLGEIKNRIQASQEQLKGFQEELGGKGSGGGLGSVLDAVSSKLGISRAAFTTTGAAVAGITAAVKVARDAFMESGRNVNEWAATVYSAKAVYESFLVSLNTGDISGFLSRIGQITKSAREAKAAMDNLNDTKAINSVPYARQMTENERIRAMIRTGRYINPIEGAPEMAEGTLLSDEYIKDLGEQLADGLKRIGDIIQQELAAYDNAIGKLYDQQATKLGMSKKDFMAGTADMTAFQKMLAGAAQYRQWEKENPYEKWVGTTNRDRKLVRRTDANPYEAYKAWDVFRVDDKLFQTIVQKIQEREALQQRQYQLLTQGYQAQNRSERVPGASADVREGLAKIPLYSQGYFTAPERLAAVGGQISSLSAPVGSVMTSEEMTSEMIKGITQLSEGFSKFSSGLSNIMSGLEKFGVDVPDGAKKVVSAIQGLMSIAQGVISVIQGVQAITTGANTTALWANTLALKANAIAQAIPFAKGGVVKAATGVVVPGTSWSGDRVPALLNSGELVLNRAQQGNLAAQLTVGGRQGQSASQPYVSGELVYLAINNYLKRSGRGELVTRR